MAVAQLESHLPVIVDPSHATGHKDLVAPMARAAIAGGADGVMIDVHPNPGEALCDGPQALRPEEMLALAKDLEALAGVLGRRMG
jgi:3-deoxy-7-phosphoheptulonate synthase